MHNPTDSFRLGNGCAIPCLGFGTWQTPDGDTAVVAVKTALQKGYRHIDAAAIYGNEPDVGRGIAASGLPRADIFDFVISEEDMVAINGMAYSGGSGLHPDQVDF